MLITAENYFSDENEMAYMGSTQYKSFVRCEAATMAKLRGEWDTPPTTALLVGSYVDTHFEGTLDIFKAKNPELFKRDGGLKSDYEYAEVIINRIERDPLFMLFMAGEKQKIVTGEISGVPFKSKIDSLLDSCNIAAIIEAHPEFEDFFGFGDGAIVDLKIMRDFEPVWNEDEHARQHFIEAWGYDYQAAIYQAVEGNMLPFFIAGASKEKPEPDIAIFTIPQSRIDEKLFEIEDTVILYQKIKRGEIAPQRCERCAYCRSTKQLDAIIDYTEVFNNAE